MADLSDVVNVLASLTQSAVYPTGTTNPSVSGAPITIVPGWPVPAQLDGLIVAGASMISLYPMPGMDANTTRFLGDSQVQSAIPAANLTLTVNGDQVTVGGAILANEAATLRVNYQPFSYQIKATDTLASVAAALSAMISGSTVSGDVITLPTGTFDIEALVSVPVEMQSEVARQTRVFMISAWCPSPANRDAICKAMDVYFKQQWRVVMPDNTWARLIYRGTLQTDELQKTRIYRRDLRYEVEYATTSTEIDNTVTNFGIALTPENGSTTDINI